MIVLENVEVQLKKMFVESVVEMVSQKENVIVMVTKMIVLSNVAD